ncbi:DUF2974 domain-containing protein [Bifidobacterium aesculapii]|uniref:DUF2974 domain-containing protein n=1 Tax=Bifidobacterium aesculapii TaxID=1329411 RepID=UPI000B099259|nr:DUF2974 domain-containing protein [Bifidobacterium aesculapii]
MGNVFDYVCRERRPLTDPDAPFNEVDALVFSSLSYEDVAACAPTLELRENGTSLAARLRTFEPRHPRLWIRGLMREPFTSVTLAEAEATMHDGEDAGIASATDGASAGGAVSADVRKGGSTDSERGRRGDTTEERGGTPSVHADDTGHTNEAGNAENADATTDGTTATGAHHVAEADGAAEADSDSRADAATGGRDGGADAAEAGPDGADDHEAKIVGLVDPNTTHDFFAAVAASPRFREARLGAVVEHVDTVEQTQFAAMTFILPDGRDWRGRPRAKDPTRGGTMVIAFRGTDDSLIGWKEDFNMAFQYPVPAQRAASAYLGMAARLWRGDIVLTGHSKGGNLAVYAAMNADPEVQRRICHVYSLDGPGFPPTIVTSREYLDIQPKVTKIVPSSSIVGQIFETPEPCRVVTSDSDGIMQHFTFSWQVEGDHFVTEPDLASSSQLFNESLNAWMAGLTAEQRERAVDALFAVLHANGATTFSEVVDGFPGSIPAMIGSMLGLSAQDRRHLLEAVGMLIRASMARNGGRPKEREKPRE